MPNPKPLLKIPAVGGPRSGQCFCMADLPPIGSFLHIHLDDPHPAFRGKWWYELDTQGGQPVYRSVGRKLPAHVPYAGRN